MKLVVDPYSSFLGKITRQYRRAASTCMYLVRFSDPEASIKQPPPPSLGSGLNRLSPDAKTSLLWMLVVPVSSSSCTLLASVLPSSSALVRSFLSRGSETVVYVL